jgi:hypothetical protein
MANLNEQELRAFTYYGIGVTSQGGTCLPTELYRQHRSCMRWLRFAGAGRQ